MASICNAPWARRRCDGVPNSRFSQFAQREPRRFFSDWRKIGSAACARSLVAIEVVMGLESCATYKVPDPAWKAKRKKQHANVVYLLPKLPPPLATIWFRLFRALEPHCLLHRGKRGFCTRFRGRTAGTCRGW